MPKTINMAFGPGRAFVIWMDEAAEKGKPPKYRTCSDKMPGNLMGHLYGRGCHFNQIHSVAIGKNGDFAMSYELLKGGGDAIWDLAHYPRMHHLLQDVEKDKRSSIRVAIGPKEGDFFFKTSHSAHCPNDNSSLTDEVQVMDHKDVQMVALGLDGCGIILSKKDGLLNHLRSQDKYHTLIQDLKIHGRVQGEDRKILSVALNPFTKNEYFVAFDNGMFCYNSVALGGKCVPANDQDKTSKTHTHLGTAGHAQNPEEIARGNAFGNLIKEWKVNDSDGDHDCSNFEEWEINTEAEGSQASCANQKSKKKQLVVPVIGAYTVPDFTDIMAWCYYSD